MNLTANSRRPGDVSPVIVVTYLSQISSYLMDFLREDRQLTASNRAKSVSSIDEVVNTEIQTMVNLGPVNQ